jgi:hypothetical protein
MPPDPHDHDAGNRPATGFPEPPGKDPGDVSGDPTPHTSLNVPVGEPDPTEWPDPYDRREDPRAPADGMSFPGDDSAHTSAGAGSTSAPHPQQDIEAPGTDPVDLDRVDD